MSDKFISATSVSYIVHEAICGLRWRNGLLEAGRRVVQSNDPKQPDGSLLWEPISNDAAVASLAEHEQRQAQNEPFTKPIRF